MKVGELISSPFGGERGGRKVSYIFRVSMSYLGLEKIRLISLFKQFGPSWRKPQVMSCTWTPQLIVGSPTPRFPTSIHLPVLQWPVFLTMLSPWEQACFSPLLSWSYKTLLKAHCTTPAFWWRRTSAFKKATVLKKARAIPSKKKGFAKQEITQVRLLFFQSETWKMLKLQLQ